MEYFFHLRSLTGIPSRFSWSCRCSRRTSPYRVAPRWQRRWTWRAGTQWGYWRRSSETWPHNQKLPVEEQIDKRQPVKKKILKTHKRRKVCCYGTLSFGSLLMVLRGRRTLKTRRDLIVLMSLPLLFLLTLKLVLRNTDVQLN